MSTACEIQLFVVVDERVEWFNPLRINVAFHDNNLSVVAAALVVNFSKQLGEDSVFPVFYVSSYAPEIVARVLIGVDSSDYLGVGNLGDSLH